MGFIQCTSSCDAKLNDLLGSLFTLTFLDFFFFGLCEGNVRLAKIAAMQHLFQNLLFYSLNLNEDSIFVFTCLGYLKRP